MKVVKTGKTGVNVRDALAVVSEGAEDVDEFAWMHILFVGAKLYPTWVISQLDLNDFSKFSAQCLLLEMVGGRGTFRHKLINTKKIVIDSYVDQSLTAWEDKADGVRLAQGWQNENH